MAPAVAAEEQDPIVAPAIRLRTGQVIPAPRFPEGDPRHGKQPMHGYAMHEAIKQGHSKAEITLALINPKGTGFVTRSGAFLTRRDAIPHAIKHQQITADAKHIAKLKKQYNEGRDDVSLDSGDMVFAKSRRIWEAAFEKSLKDRIMALKPKDVSAHEWDEGVKHEAEHKDSVPTKLGQAKIAADHLSEDPHYYSKLKKIEKSVTPDDDYLYHTTEHDNLSDIREEGLKPFTPDYRGEQDYWPTAAGGPGNEGRVYFGPSAKHVESFQASPRSALLRVRRSDLKHTKIHRELGDLFVRDAVPPHLIEHKNHDVWERLAPQLKKSFQLVPEHEWNEMSTTDEPDDHYYHITSAPAAARILEEGLRPSKGRKIAGKGPYAVHSAGKVFLTERPGVSFWTGKIENHLFDQHDDPPAVAVLRIPKHAVGGLENDPVGSEDARHPAYMSSEPIGAPLKKSETDDDDYGLPPMPGTAPIPDGHIRLYHQTDAKNLDGIRKEGLHIKHARGIEGPKAIYADESGFYGKPGDIPTVEFHVPADKFRRPFVLAEHVPNEQIVAIHEPWHRIVRYLADPKHEEARAATLRGDHDHMLDDPKHAKAINHIKSRYGGKKMEKSWADAGDKPNHSSEWTVKPFTPLSDIGKTKRPGSIQHARITAPGNTGAVMSFKHNAKTGHTEIVAFRAYRYNEKAYDAAAQAYKQGARGVDVDNIMQYHRSNVGVIGMSGVRAAARYLKDTIGSKTVGGLRVSGSRMANENNLPKQEARQVGNLETMPGVKVKRDLGKSFGELYDSLEKGQFFQRLIHYVGTMGAKAGARAKDNMESDPKVNVVPMNDGKVVRITSGPVKMSQVPAFKRGKLRREVTTFEPKSGEKYIDTDTTKYTWMNDGRVSKVQMFVKAQILAALQRLRKSEA